MRSKFVQSLVLAAVCVPPASAQRVPPDLGETVRVAGSVFGWVEGDLLGKTVDTLYLDRSRFVRGTDTLALWIDDVTDVTVLRCCKSAYEGAVQGAWFGALIGFAFGGASAAVGCATDNILCGRDGLNRSFETRLVPFLVTRIVGGAAIGAILGTQIRSDRWTSFPLSDVPPLDGGR